jgi:hypothetical protein
MIGPLAVRFRTTVKVNEVMKMTREREERGRLDRWLERDEVIEG